VNTALNTLFIVGYQIKVFHVLNEAPRHENVLFLN